MRLKISAATASSMLQCHVRRPPHSADDAWALAIAHDLFAPDINIDLRHLAEGLREHDFWFLQRN